MGHTMGNLELDLESKNPAEIEANQFAAELLMPRAMIDQVMAGKQFDIDDDRPIEELAKKFRVSKQALEYRIRSR